MTNATTQRLTEAMHAFLDESQANGRQLGYVEGLSTAIDLIRVRAETARVSDQVGVDLLIEAMDDILNVMRKVTNK